MATIPSGTRFIGIAPSVDLKKRKSAVLNKTTEPFTIEDIKGYKSYTALLTQNGLDAPTSIVLENTIGEAFISYNGIGRTQILISRGFKANKTTVVLSNPMDNGGFLTGIGGASVITSSAIFLNTKDLIGENDDLLYKTLVEIRVYN